MAETSTIAPVSTSAPVTSAAPVSTSTSTPETATPLSTSDIAADVIADLESSGDDDNTPPEPVAPAAAAPVVPAVDPDDFDAIPAEIVDSLGRKRVNTIPHTRFKTMLEKREQKSLAVLAKELGLTTAEGAALKMDDIIATVKEHGTKRTGYETRLKSVDAVENLIKTDADRFMQFVGEINPAFKEFVKKGTAAPVAAAATTKPAVQDDPEPQPDYDLGNGQFTYSREGLKKLREWDHRQAVKEANAGLDGRLKPFEEKAKAEQDRAEHDAWYAERLAFHTQRLEKARKWPKFVDHEPAILKAMQANPAISMEDAYFQVAGPDLAGDRTKIRKEVLDEIEKQPKTSSVAVSPAVTKPADNKPKSTADVAREIIAQFQ